MKTTRRLQKTSISEDNDFFVRVYEVVRLVPCGRITTYGAVASVIGSPGAARMVGWALNKCGSQPDYVPAHRVVNRNGLLTGKHFFGGENTMKELLENEGVCVSDNRIVDFDRHFWDPADSL
jgi:methylated-DNA-protein-cysteine methyltransferase related protein